MSDLIEENVLTEKKKKYKQKNLRENVYAYKIPSVFLLTLCLLHCKSCKGKCYQLKINKS